MNSFHKRTAQGMTLFELLLVLVLLAVISSLAQPIFDGAFASVRLRRASDQVLAAWSELRTQAIQTGEPHQFLFQAETGKYRLGPWQELETIETTPLLEEEIVEYGEWQPHEAELPEEIEFLGGDQLVEQDGAEASVQSLGDAVRSDWAGPIVFYPDGSSTAASLLLKNKRDLVLRITLRGLSGMGRTSEIMTKEESERKLSQ